LSPARTPTATPRHVPITSALPVKVRVAGTRSAMLSSTGWCELNETPKSSWASCASQFRYCTTSGWSSPYRWRSRSTSSALMPLVWAA
jgi:hypothetical protein